MGSGWGNTEHPWVTNLFPGWFGHHPTGAWKWPADLTSERPQSRRDCDQHYPGCREGLSESGPAAPSGPDSLAGGGRGPQEPGVCPGSHREKAHDDHHFGL